MDTAFLFIAISAAGWILLIVGLLFQRRWLRKQEQERTRATGVVVDYADNTAASSPHCTPVVEFTAEGQTLRLPCKGVFEREKYPIGQTLDILYNADDPTSFHPDNAEEPAVGRGLMRFGLVWIVIAVLLTAVLIGPIKGSVKRPEPKRPSMLTPAPTIGRSPWGSAEGFGYALDENGFATLTGYTGSDSDVTLPILIDGHIVSGISQSAFTGNRRLARVTVPGSMRAVPSGAFAGCIALDAVTLKDGVQYVGVMAFEMCPSLKDVTLPASLTFIGKNAFPADCAATFHVAEGSAAEKYCVEMGFAVDTAV